MHIVGKTYQCHVFRNVEFHLSYCRVGGKCYYVVESQNGIRTVGALQEVQRVFHCRGIVNLVAHHYFSVYRYAVFTQCLKISVFSPFHHVEVVRSSNEGDASASGGDEMFGCHLGCLVAVGSHGGELVAHASSSEEHERYSHVGNLLKVGIVGGVLCKTGNDALHVHVDEVVNSLCLCNAVFVTVCTDDRIARLCRFLFNAVENGGIEMGQKVGDHNTDYFRSLTP